MSHPTHHLAKHLTTLTALLTLVLTITLPTIELLTPTTTHTNHPTHTTATTPHSPHTTKADKAAAAHDGCRQQTPTTSSLLARPSCRTGMPTTHDHMTQAPDTPHPSHHTTTHPTPMNKVPPAWADHWGAAAHSPYHRSQA